jgi:hypothetical protein
MVRKMLALFFLTLTAVCGQTPGERITDGQALEIGKRIWKNECAGTVSGLTSWNKGEAFPSLGIAHFIWYPEGRRQLYEESWPKLARFLKSTGAPVQAWMLGACPWKTRAAFLDDLKSPRLTSLRLLLSETVPAQARYAAMRLEAALPKMLAAAPAAQRAKVELNFHRISAEPLGFYALVDYVNFKGEGVNPSERYNGKGWGLLQVLEAMPSTGKPLPEFARAADSVLTRRVNNAPPALNEAKWLPGWRNRLHTYTQ